MKMLLDALLLWLDLCWCTTIRNLVAKTELNQEVATFKAISTDGEKTLVDATLRNFPQAAYFCCFRYLQQNVERHLS